MLATVPVSAPDALELQAVRAPPRRNNSAKSATVILRCANAPCDSNKGSPFLSESVVANQARAMIFCAARRARNGGLEEPLMMYVALPAHFLGADKADAREEPKWLRRRLLCEPHPLWRQCHDDSRW
jgi:hypothetical protein